VAPEYLTERGVELTVPNGYLIQSALGKLTNHLANGPRSNADDDWGEWGELEPNPLQNEVECFFETFKLSLWHRGYRRYCRRIWSRLNLSWEKMCWGWQESGSRHQMTI